MTRGAQDSNVVQGVFVELDKWSTSSRTPNSKCTGNTSSYRIATVDHIIQAQSWKAQCTISKPSTHHRLALTAPYGEASALLPADIAQQIVTLCSFIEAVPNRLLRNAFLRLDARKAHVPVKSAAVEQNIQRHADKRTGTGMCTKETDIVHTSSLYLQ